MLDSSIKLANDFFLPKIIRLLNSISHIYKKHMTWKKHLVIARDNFTCAYCGRTGKRSDLSVDHILPRSRGGKDTWLNTVCACRSCNTRKDDRTPEEANMKLLFKPRVPTMYEFLQKKLQQMGVENFDLSTIMGA